MGMRPVPRSELVAGVKGTFSSVAFAGIAKACEQNLQKTLRFGGRLEFPSNMELRAMLVSLQQG